MPNQAGSTGGGSQANTGTRTIKQLGHGSYVGECGGKTWEGSTEHEVRSRMNADLGFIPTGQYQLVGQQQGATAGGSGSSSGSTGSTA
jgi:hypothetical protein